MRLPLRVCPKTAQPNRKSLFKAPAVHFGVGCLEAFLVDEQEALEVVGQSPVEDGAFGSPAAPSVQEPLSLRGSSAMDSGASSLRLACSETFISSSCRAMGRSRRSKDPTASL